MPVKKPIKKTHTPEAAAAAPETMKKAPSKRAATTKTAAATHKNAAGRVTAPRAEAAPRTKNSEPVKAAFDAALHHAEIEREAYFLWEARGYTDGNAGQDWLNATELVRTRYA
jgi:hypothetical protein